MKLVLEILNIETVRDAFKVGHIADSDRKKVDELINQGKAILERHGAEANPENYYLLGILYSTKNQFENAEACFSETLNIDPGKGNVSLAMIYQLRANEIYGMTIWDLQKNC